MDIPSCHSGRTDFAFEVWDPEGVNPGILGSSRRVCTMCHALHPDDFMADLAAGHIIEPTTKSYKAYILDPATRRRCKFYYVHLNAEQRARLVDMLNDGQVAVSGNWWPLPFFMREVSR